MKSVVLFGHGSRDPQWRVPMDAVAARLRVLDPSLDVRCAFLELQAPDLPTAAGDAVHAGATRLTVLPMFLGAGRHAREDLPRLLDAVRLAHPSLSLVALPPVGEDPRVLDLLARLALGD